MNQQLLLIVKGRVQGVFFRRTAKEYAQEFGLTGYARNLENGDVEICAQGPKEKLEMFIKKIKENSGRAKVESLSAHYSTPTINFSDFQTL
ncbi:MAG TPA: acylphosphatase [Chlamydiales bacterium]|nr:acylphosphatase [Chlamydiales bacterium]